MKKLFTAIQKNDHATVAALLDKSPELIRCVHQGNPKKFDGQSPLQVALKTADTQMVELLLVYRPDVNFMETESCANDWRAPVLHDAIDRAIMATRWNVRRPDGLEVFNTEKAAKQAFSLLRTIIERGADVNAKDSYGNAGMDRACLQARQILPRPNSADRVLTQELRDDLNRVFDLLKRAGADMSYTAPNAFGKSYREQYADETVSFFLA